MRIARALRERLRRVRAHVGAARTRRRRQEAAKQLYGSFRSFGDLYFDVGANVGNRTKMFRAIGARVVAIEPQPECAEALRQRFRDDDRVTVVETALGPEPGTAELLLAPYDTLASLSSEWVERVRAAGRFQLEWDRKITVSVTTLDALIEEHGVPAFCKIDVEGYEAQVLAGLKRPVAALSFEFTPEHLDAAIACVDRLEELGFERFALSAGESLELAQWSDSASIRDALRNAPQDGRFFGDVYAKLS